MLFVGTLTNRAEAADFIAANGLTDDHVILRAAEGDRPVGYTAAVVYTEGQDVSVHIAALEGEDDDICELLLRAAVNFGERRGAQKVTTAVSQPEKRLVALGFRLIDGQMTTEVGNVVHMCKNCHNSGK